MAVFRELSNVKQRLFDLQRLTQEATAAADRGEPIPPGLHERLNALAEEQMMGVPMDDGDDSEMEALADGVAGLSSSVRCGCRFSVRPVIDGARFRSAYEDKVREQQRVLYSLQEEKSRLASIKNELSRLRRGSAADADRTSNGKCGACVSYDTV